MLIRKSPKIAEAEVTPYELYLNRRQFIGQASRLALLASATPSALAACEFQASEARAAQGDGQEDQLTSYEDVTTYNNFY